MRKDPQTPEGGVQSIWCDSALLKDNFLGESPRRRIDVYLPHGYDGKGLPLLVDVVGFLAGGPVHANWKNFGENLPERLDRLIAAGDMPPCVVAMPDCFTCLGGNQYINGPVMGPWADFLIQEVVPMLETQFGLPGQGRS